MNKIDPKKAQLIGFGISGVGGIVGAITEHALTDQTSVKVTGGLTQAGTTLKWVGIAVALGGVILYFAATQMTLDKLLTTG